ncbi:MAG TPA: STAS/SEC14 domain-containing protein [Victivallales bacterium]|nr:STAS/SEC14 domain-containing protein [Victivallales bacterium]
MKILERTAGRVIGFDAPGKITEEELAEVIKYFKLTIEKYGSISWLGSFKNFKGFKTFKALKQDLIFNLKNLKNYDRTAIVGNKLWLKISTKTAGLITGIKYFDISQLEEAWKYIEDK